MRKNNNPAVSILIPVYNRSHLISRSIKSVFAQEFKDFEIIIVDDGSIDNLKEVIDAFKDHRIVYVRNQKNMGIGYSRNRAVSLARGSLIAFIDSDDEWMPGKLQNQIEIMLSFPEIDFLFGNFINYNEMHFTSLDGFLQTQKGISNLEIKNISRDEKLNLIVKGMPESLLIANFISPCTVVVRREVLLRAGNFNPSLSGPEDFEMWWRLGINGCSWAYTDEIISKRNKNETSISNISEFFSFEYIKALDICVETCIEKKRFDLLKLLHERKHYAYCSLIRYYALSGKRKKAVNAFKSSTKFGFSLRAFYLLFGAIAGPKLINILRRRN